ncbi:MAG: NAD-dependent epimerase/dehydratase family protein, partial [Anaerolineales bacterium]
VFNAYGPGQPLAAAHPPVVPHFLRQVSHGGSIVIHGKGEQTRDFVYLDDVIAAMVAAASAPTINRSVINIGSGTETSIQSLGQSVLEAVGVKSEWIYKEDQDAGPSRMCADIRLAKEKLGYRPRFSLQEGLERMISKDPRFRHDSTSG